MNDLTDCAACRFPAEWECANPVVVMALPHRSTDWAYMLGEAQVCYRDMIQAIVPFARVVLLAPDIDETRGALGSGLADSVTIRAVATDDTWTRDYMPLTVEAADGSMRCLDFTFNGWGMKFASANDNMVTRRLEAAGLFGTPVACCKAMVLEGGSVDSDGRGNLLVTSECLLSPNRNPWLDRDAIDAQLRLALGVERVLWLDHGYLAGDDTDSHVDTLARFAPGGGIVYVGCDDTTDEHYEALTLMERQIQQLTDASGHRFTLWRLPLPHPIYDEEGQRLPATYANFLALPQAVVMPTYAQPDLDRQAADTLRQAFGLPVVTVDCRALIRQHGSLHCSTMQIPASALKL